MPEIEYAVDIWDLSGTDGRPDAEPLLEHLREFAAQGGSSCGRRSTSISSGMGQATCWCSSEPSRISPSSPDRVPHAGNLAVGAGDLWVTSDYRKDAAAEDVVVVGVDPQANRAVEMVAVGGHPIDVAVAAGAVWVSVASPGRLLRIAGR